MSALSPQPVPPVGSPVLAVKIWRDGKRLRHWDRPRRGVVVGHNPDAQHGVLVAFGSNEIIGFEPLEVWHA